MYASEESNQHSGALVFLLGQLLSSIPFLFLISISSSLVFYFLVGLRNEFSLLMYFVLNFFMCLLVNEGLILVIASIWRNLFWDILVLMSIHVSHSIPYFYLFVRFNVVPRGKCIFYPQNPLYISGGDDAFSRILQNSECFASTIMDISNIIHCFPYVLDPGKLSPNNILILLFLFSGPGIPVLYISLLTLRVMKRKILKKCAGLGFFLQYIMLMHRVESLIRI